MKTTESSSFAEPVQSLSPTQEFNRSQEPFEEQKQEKI
jgi:hypothetical protein